MAEEQKGVSVPSIAGMAGTALEQGKAAMRTHGDNAEVFMLMNSRDENQIMRELMGHFSEEYVYDIPFRNSDGTTTHARGLSWSGIKEARRLYGGIDVDIIEGPTLHGDPSDESSFYTCKARAKDLKTGNATTAAYRQKLWGKRKGGGVYQIEFAFEFAQSKAKRNAIAELLPQPLVKAWINDYVEGKPSFDPHRVIELQEGDIEVRENKKPSSPPRSSSPPPQGGGRKSGGRGQGGGGSRRGGNGGGRGQGGGGRRGDGGGPPMTATQFGMIHKLVKEKGVDYPSFMLDENGEPYRDFDSFPEEKKVPVGTASDIISKLLAGQPFDDPGAGTTTPPSNGREPGQDDGEVQPGSDDFALE